MGLFSTKEENETVQTLTCNLYGKFDIKVNASLSEADLNKDIEEQYLEGIKNYRPKVTEITRKVDGTIVDVRIE